MPVANPGSEITPWSSFTVVEDGMVNSGASLTALNVIVNVAVLPKLLLGGGPARPLSLSLTTTTAEPLRSGAVLNESLPVPSMVGS